MSVHVVRRVRKSTSWHVRCRPAGRYGPTIHLGSFPTRKLAELCAEWARKQEAVGVIPDRRAMLRSSTAPSEPVAVWAQRWLDAQPSFAPATIKNRRMVIRRLDRMPIGGIPVDRVSVRDVQDVVTELAADGCGAEHTRRIVGVIRQALDEAGVEPNPARDKRVRLPSVTSRVEDPPDADRVRAVFAAAWPAHVLILAVIEGAGLRPAEAAALHGRDVLRDRGELRVAGREAGARKTGSRLIPTPDDLLGLLPIVGPDERLFSTTAGGSLSVAIGRAAKRGGVEPFSPYSLRHRWISRQLHLHHPVHLVARWAGHQASETLDTYAHVMTDTDEAWRVLLDPHAARLVHDTSPSRSARSTSARSA